MNLKKVIILFGINLFLVLMQTSFLNVFFGAALNPDLVLAFALALLLANKSEYSLFSALIGGLIYDLRGTNLIGESALLMIAVLFAISYSRKYVFKGWPVQILSLFVSFVLYKTISNAYNAGIVVNSLSTLVFCLLMYLYISRVINRSSEIKI